MSCPYQRQDPSKGRALSNTNKAARSNPANPASSTSGTQTAAINSGGFTNAGGTTTGFTAPATSSLAGAETRAIPVRRQALVLVSIAFCSSGRYNHIPVSLYCSNYFCGVGPSQSKQFFGCSFSIPLAIGFTTCYPFSHRVATNRAHFQLWSTGIFTRRWLSHCFRTKLD